jgi:hypothetical protein
LGLLAPCPTPQSNNQQVLSNMADVFDGLPPVPSDDALGLKAGFPFLATLLVEDIDISKVDVSDHWGPEAQQSFINTLRKHARLFHKELGRFNDGVTMLIQFSKHARLFHKELGRFNDGVTMLIQFKEDANLDGLRQAPLDMSQRDRDAADGILDPLRQEGALKKLPLGQPSPAASPVSVVWRNGEPKSNSFRLFERFEQCLWSRTCPNPSKALSDWEM